MIEEVFDCKTANEYGCSETGGFVYECPQGNWHIASELTLIEVLDHNGKPQPPGQSGEIVVTHLRNNYMPLIRYKIGDRGALLSGVCSCGRRLPLMKVTVAKESDIFRLFNQKTYSSEIFDYINIAVLEKYPNSILQFRVVQKTLEDFEVEFIKGSESCEFAKDLFLQKIRQELGKDIKVNFKEVKKIVREATGKKRYFISNIN